MEAGLLVLAAFVGSLATFYSGFGLGTILLPVFALVLPAPTAIAATAIVHLANSLFKAALLRQAANWAIAWRFALFAVPASALGALALGALAQASAPVRWGVGPVRFEPSAAGLAAGLMLLGLTALELTPWFQRLSAPLRLLPLGGLIVGFVGGLTGQQGALRSVFLLKAGLSAPAMIATGSVIAAAVDLARLPLYASQIAAGGLSSQAGLWIGLSCLAAFAGAALGFTRLKAARVGSVRLAVAALMAAGGAALVTGVIG